MMLNQKKFRYVVIETKMAGGRIGIVGDLYLARERKDSINRKKGT
jgi:hypothetical protein